MAGTVEFALDDGVAWLWLNRPDRLNAVAPELVGDLLAALDAAASPDVHAVVLAGRGRAFCAGHDLKQQAREGDVRADVERIQDVTRRIRALRAPVIAAVHGYAIGAGAEFALGCDLVVAADDAVFAFPEAGLGLSVTGGASRLLPLLVGPLKAKELLLLGERIDAATAHGLGLVNTVVGEAKLIDTARAWARTIAAKPAASVTLAKRALDAGVDQALETVLELEVAHAVVTDALPGESVTAARFRERGEATT